jgi:phosphoglycerate dehydrogenase-like enzyme
VTDPAASRVKVLVPDDLGVEALGTAPNLHAIRYVPGDPWPAEHRDATVVVVDYDHAPETAARFPELPGLRLLQTLNAGYEQWLPHLPAGVLLSNGRGAHGGSSAEWVVAALLSIYRVLRPAAG